MFVPPFLVVKTLRWEKEALRWAEYTPKLILKLIWLYSKCHVTSYSKPETLLPVSSVSKSTMFVTPFLVINALMLEKGALRWAKYKVKLTVSPL